MRVIQRDFRKVKFLRIETLPQVHAIAPGLEVVTWSTEKRAIAAKATIPLLPVITPDEWSRMRRASLASDSWLADEYTTDEWLC